MILYPAIDLKDGRCVRLAAGRMETATIFNEDPAEQAVLFQTAGFSWIHIVDLDGAHAGEPKNAGAIARILESAAVPVQVGGGVRKLEALHYWFTAGASRVVMGTAAVRDPAFARQAAREFPGRVVFSVDTRDGRVAVSGWAEQTELDAVECARRLEDSGAAALVVTDIARDGLKAGINVDLTGRVADAVSVPVIASGGFQGLADIAALKAWPGAPIHGLILGRALYDGDVSAVDALAAAAP
jgi:phosphoribosylformimino-5-aminoimidazole carboxamide ribotide isomerase